jgi:hypothetical protein
MRMRPRFRCEHVLRTTSIPVTSSTATSQLRGLLVPRYSPRDRPEAVSRIMKEKKKLAVSAKTAIVQLANDYLGLRNNRTP